KAGPVERVEHDYQLWEKRVDALMVLLSRKRQFTVDELRKGIESLPGDAYDRLTYYERWISSIASALVHRGIISIEELRSKLAEIEKRPDGPKAKSRRRASPSVSMSRSGAAIRRGMSARPIISAASRV